MNLWSAAVFLVRASFRNWTLSQVRRLRRPRYAVGLVAVVLYAWSVGARGWMQAVAPTPGSIDGIELMLCAIALLGIGAAWVLGGDDAVIRFTQAEVQFLFPAPATRRQLVVYKVGRTLIGTLFSAVLATLLFGPRVTIHPVWFFVGAWIALSALNLHLSAASLTRAMLVDFGLAGLRRRLLTLAVLVGVLGVFVWAAVWITPPPDLSEGADHLVAWAIAAVREPPLGWVLLPLRAPIAVALAPDQASFLAALPVAIAVLGVHALWVVSTATAFEDASVAASERRATLVQVQRRGWSPLHHARPPFGLAGSGRPEVALIWKAMIAAVRLASLRIVLALAVLTLTSASVVTVLVDGESSWFGVGALVAVTLAGYLSVIGAQLLRVDLRLDLAQIDLLRSYPLTGRAVVTGEVVGPAVILALGEWACLVAALVLGTGWHGPPEPSERVLWTIALAIALPVLSLCGVVVQNGAVLLFPEWAALDAQVGPEALGRRLILLVANFLLLLFAMFPATVAAALVLAFGLPFVGNVAFVLAAVAGAVVVLTELWVVIGWLGRRFEQFDLSEQAIS